MKYLKDLLEAAKTANGRSRACAKCPVQRDYKICPPAFMGICSKAFMEGFMKGAKWQENKGGLK